MVAVEMQLEQGGGRVLELEQQPPPPLEAGAAESSGGRGPRVQARPQPAVELS
jgi:hypothetical protein